MGTIFIIQFKSFVNYFPEICVFDQESPPNVKCVFCGEKTIAKCGYFSYIYLCKNETTKQPTGDKTMTRNQALNDPYIVRLRELLATATGSRKAYIIRQIELKVDLLTGKITQADYNNKLFESIAGSMNAGNFGI